MISCPKCDSSIDVEEEDLDEGEVLSCDECGATLRVHSLNPVELEPEDDGGKNDSDPEYDDDDEEENEEDDDSSWH